MSVYDFSNIHNYVIVYIGVSGDYSPPQYFLVFWCYMPIMTVMYRLQYESVRLRCMVMYSVISLSFMNAKAFLLMLICY